MITDTDFATSTRRQLLQKTDRELRVQAVIAEMGPKHLLHPINAVTKLARPLTDDELRKTIRVKGALTRQINKRKNAA